jgi:ion channel-forming bestrophin family protein
MLSYDPKDWLKAVVRFQRSDTLRRLLPWIFVICLYSWFVAWLEIEYWQLGPDTPVRNINLMHSILGVVLSFVLVFRTNTAYDRWWEARRLWGQLINQSRSMALKLSVILPKQDVLHRNYFKQALPNIGYALNNHLRHEATRLALFEDNDPAWQSTIKNAKHLPNAVLGALIERIYRLQQNGIITDTHLLLLNTEIHAFSEIIGACERIKNTPIPYSYSAFIKKFILIYVTTLPFGFAFSLGYLCVPVVGFIFYVLASLELVAEEIEDPFGIDENDLPLQRLTENLKQQLEEILS